MAYRHGHARRAAETSEHRSWIAMMTRCFNPRRDDYKYYGGRGITVCPQWREFTAFLADMGPKPSPEYTLERENTNKNYEPGNCRWATRAEQSQNCRSNRLLTIEGRTQHLNAWGRESTVSVATIHGRLAKGWDARRAVFTPAQPAGAKRR
jgi:hypothetical protein